MLPAACLTDALVKVFGLQAAEFAQKYQEQLESGQGLQNSSFNPTTCEPETLRFPEFLIFGRKVREGEYAKLKEEGYFQKIDSDHSGTINEGELNAALRKMGFTPLKQVLGEILKDVVAGGVWGPDSEMDFDEFFDFMVIFRQRDGWLKWEVEELRMTFNRFDEDGTGEISALELSALFRHLGYGASMEEIRDLVNEVDANGTQQLDFREYLRLMRNHREKELLRIAAVFDANKDRESGVLPRPKVVEALAELDHEPPKALLLKNNTHNFDFDAFVGLVDSCRNAWVSKQRKKAGFSKQQIQEFQDLFDKFDKDKSGEIDMTELLSILKEFGWQPKTKEEQADLMKKLDVARALAREAGINEVGPDGSPAIKFWSFVQLCRMLHSQHDKAEEENMNKLMAEVQFSQLEVDQFRQIFRNWAKTTNVFVSRVSQSQGPQTEYLHNDVAKRLVRSTLAAALSQENKTAVDSYIARLSEEGDGERDQLDFPSFLKLMRWLVDNSAVGQLKEPVQPARRLTA